MADYKELLRRAIGALPENNGAARRGVYEKARTALVGQLRAINPPLPAKDITQHRLQLEDCIRQVEQEASEAIIALKQLDEISKPSSNAAAPAATTPVAEAPKPAMEAAKPAPEAPKPAIELPKSGLIPKAAEPAVKPVAAEAAKTQMPEAGSIADIIAEAERTAAEPVAAKPAESTPTEVKAAEAKPDPVIKLEPRSEPKTEDNAPLRPDFKAPRAMPSIVARAEAAKSGPTSPISGSSGSRTFEPARRAPSFEPRRDSGNAAAAHHVPVAAPRLEPSVRAQAAARQQVAEPLAVVDEPSVAPAMSAVREVEVEPDASKAPTADAQQAIANAIEVLDREARGETTTPPANGTTIEFPAKTDAKPADPKTLPFREPVMEPGFARAERERSGSSAITIFLVVFVLLLAIAGGGGYWAVREGYIDPNAMFGKGSTPVVSGTAIPETANETSNTTELQPTATQAIESVAPAGTDPAVIASADPTDEVSPEDRLPPTVEGGTAVLSGDPAAPVTEPLALADATPAGETPKDESQLPVSSEGAALEPLTPTPGTADAALVPGSQSLLLEAAATGKTGAVPFTGTVEWTKGVDEVGQPTLVGEANIPARNLSVHLLIRKNSDASLPASHLMEINFDVSDTFIGGQIGALPGVLLKNEELVQGTPLVGASAKVVGNQFLFALSSAAKDSESNNNLMVSGKWIDLAIIYATGTKAIITLEKDDTAQTLFKDVFATWSEPATASVTQ